jgi:hypothetical protein
VQQQQQIHLHIRQQQMLAAVLAGNPAVLAQLSSVPPNTPPQDQPFPVPLRPVRHQLGCRCCRMPSAAPRTTMRHVGTSTSLGVQQWCNGVNTGGLLCSCETPQFASVLLLLLTCF